MVGGQNIRANREEWLFGLLDRLRSRVFARTGYELPTNIRISCSFASGKGLAPKNRVMGQVWDASASSDGHYEILISPNLDDPVEVAAVVAHEAVHVAVGIEHGHRGAFKRCAIDIGLEGPMRSTRAGAVFLARVAPILAELGPYPHARLGPKLGVPLGKSEDRKSSGPKPQKGRLRKAQCEECGLILRLSKSWIEGRKLTCPDLDCGGHDRLLQIS